MRDEGVGFTWTYAIPGKIGFSTYRLLFRKSLVNCSGEYSWLMYLITILRVLLFGSPKQAVWFRKWFFCCFSVTKSCPTLLKTPLLSEVFLYLLYIWEWMVGGWNTDLILAFVWWPFPTTRNYYMTLNNFESSVLEILDIWGRKFILLGN